MWYKNGSKIQLALFTVKATPIKAWAAPKQMVPKNESATFWVGSATRDRFQRAEMVVDQYTGEVIQRVGFADNQIIAKAVSLGHDRRDCRA